MGLLGTLHNNRHYPYFGSLLIIAQFPVLPDAGWAPILTTGGFLLIYGIA